MNPIFQIIELLTTVIGHANEPKTPNCTLDSQLYSIFQILKVQSEASKVVAGVGGYSFLLSFLL